jgi:hypothetical protein
VQVEKLSLFVGLLESVKEIVPVGVVAVPVFVSVTVTVKLAVPPMGALALVGVTVVVVERVPTVKIAAVVVLLVAWMLSFGVKLALIVCAPVGVLAVTVTVQVTVPMGFAP